MFPGGATSLRPSSSYSRELYYINPPLAQAHQRAQSGKPESNSASQSSYTSMAPASLSSSAPKAPPVSTATVRTPAAFAASTSHTESPTAIASLDRTPV